MNGVSPDPLTMYIKEKRYKTFSQDLGFMKTKKFTYTGENWMS